MMIPVILFLGLNPQECLGFQIVQTILDYIFVFLLLYVVLKKINENAYDRRKLLLTAFSIEGVHIISSFMWYFFVLYAIGGFIIELLFLFFVPYFTIYLLYTQHSSSSEIITEERGDESIGQGSYLSTGRAILLYLCSVPPALVLSSILTSTLFNLFGIYNFFIFS